MHEQAGTFVKTMTTRKEIIILVQLGRGLLGPSLGCNWLYIFESFGLGHPDHRVRDVTMILNG